MDSRWYFEFNLLPQSVSSIYFLDPSNSCSMNCIDVFFLIVVRVEWTHYILLGTRTSGFLFYLAMQSLDFLSVYLLSVLENFQTKYLVKMGTPTK